MNPACGLLCDPIDDGTVVVVDVLVDPRMQPSPWNRLLWNHDSSFSFLVVVYAHYPYYRQDALCLGCDQSVTITLGPYCGIANVTASSLLHLFHNSHDSMIHDAVHVGLSILPFEIDIEDHVADADVADDDGVDDDFGEDEDTCGDHN
jgi:hypothetical protein